MTIPLTDLKAQYLSIKPEIDSAIARVVESGRFILGPEVAAFEEEVAKYIGVKYAVGVASGTDALHLALLACGIEPGDEVITTPFTFIATAESVSRCGATPVFVDIDPETLCIDPDRIVANITGKTKAMLPVHLYGRPADMSTIAKIARLYRLKVIEDCAQAVGAVCEERKVGSLGDAGCLSFFPSKGLGGYGDGGMVVTDNQEVAERVRLLRAHGAKAAYYHDTLGFNSRLDAIQAAILRVKLPHLDNWIARRRGIAEIYNRGLVDVKEIVTPKASPGHTFNYYTVRVGGQLRDRLRKHLREAGIETAVYYPLSLHMQKAYWRLGYKRGEMLESEQAEGEVLSLPMYPEMTDGQVDEVVEQVKKHFTHYPMI